VNSPPAIIAAYAARLHRLAGDAHHVASPLGAWALLALVAPIARDAQRDALELALGAPLDDAHDLALRLLAEPHPAVPLAAAAWGVETGVARRLFGPDVDVGEVPDQTDADAWTREHTLGLIDEFPLRVAKALVVLATAIATKITWWRPFEVAPAEQAELASTSGFAPLARLLHDPGGDGPTRQLIADTDAGLVAVHAASSRDDDLVVVSVSADPSVPYDWVLAVAHPVATALARHEPVPGQRSLFDLPLGRGHSWSLSESTERTPHRERFRTLLPAWSATAKIDLMAAPDVGFPAAADALLRAVPEAERIEATQAAVARYTRTGFEAAAVTGMAVRAAAVIRPAGGVTRTATLQFTHPYAVVAAACDAEGGAWSGLPVFSAWVAEGDEPEADRRR
jgi:hypothetical protein